MEDWAEIRRLHRAEGVPIKEISRRLGVARNTVRAALNSDRPPKYERAPRRRVPDAFEPQTLGLLNKWTTMPAPVIAERIKWPYSNSPLTKKPAEIRPESVGIDPVDRVTYEPGQITRCDLWFPEAVASAEGPLLVALAGAGPQFELGAVGGGRPGHVEAEP